MRRAVCASTDHTSMPMPACVACTTMTWRHNVLLHENYIGLESIRINIEHLQTPKVTKSQS